MFCVFFFFLFKQNTAYEIRISDWSSDVCSSDLFERRPPGRRFFVRAAFTRPGVAWWPPWPEGEVRHGVRRPVDSAGTGADQHHAAGGRAAGAAGDLHDDRAGAFAADPAHAAAVCAAGRGAPAAARADPAARSEEHTSELQSLMRISY